MWRNLKTTSTARSHSRPSGLSSDRAIRHGTVSVILTLVIVGLFQFEMPTLDGILTDCLYRTQWWRHADPRLAVIGYDQASSGRYSGSRKIPVEEFDKILQILGAAKPAGVGLFLPLNEKIYSEAELATLSESIDASGLHVTVGYTDDASLGQAPPPSMRRSNRYLPGMVSRDNFSYGADGVTRRVMTAIDGMPTAYTELARHFAKIPTTQPFRNEHTYMGSESRQLFIKWQGKPPAYPYIPSQQVAEGRVPREDFTGKIVILGNVFPSADPSQFILTPYSRTLGETSYLEGVAQSLATLIGDQGLTQVSFITRLAISLMIGIFTVNSVLFLSPMRGIMVVMCELGIFCVTGWLLLFGFGIALPLAHPALTIGIAYYLVIPYRLLSEYRTRWHYQEKSEFISQLEQLKSNFLSLMSHDLKTPIARIQGSAELLLQSPRLDQKEKQSLDGIVKTTEELSLYVQTILDLARIENQSLPLQTTTRDINVTLSEVVDSKRAIASERKIEIVTHLEPMFSFKFDPKLIERVVANLLENAIQYSPDGTTIVLSSTEDGNWAHVSVTDQGKGIPLAEHERVFEKFYRGPESSLLRTNGTGLGLYLVKYFVELHQGFVKLQSDLGKGSTFTVSLPV